MGHKYVKEEDTFNTSANGTVPKPTAQEVSDNKYLRADGTWKNPPGGGGGSNVTITPTLSSGTKIADFEIDGTPGELYAPSGGSSAHNYSTTEQVVGTWIDGKPVYEITVESTTTRDGSVSTTQSVSTGVSDIKELIDLRGAASYGANTAWLPFTFSDNASSGLTNSRVKIIAVGNDGNVFFEIGNNYNGANCINKVIITIRYTKTTD